MIKKTLLTLALVGATVVAYGQGTIGFANSALTKVKLYGTTTNDVPVTAGLLNYGVFWGATPGSLELATGPLGANSTTSAGIIAGGASGTYAIPGSQPLTAYYMQIKGWSASFGSDWNAARTGGTWYGETDVRLITTAVTLGPGTSIWQTSDTNPAKFLALKMLPVPEPTSFALAGLGAAALLIFRRRK